MKHEQVQKKKKARPTKKGGTSNVAPRPIESSPSTIAEGHPATCPCARCSGLRRYPQPTLCDWCQTVHAGDSYNCPSNRTLDTRALGGDDDPRPDHGDADFSNDSDQVSWAVSSVKKAVAQITLELKEAFNMITIKGGQALPPTQPGRRQRSGFPFLSNDVLTKDPQTARILAVKQDKDRRGNPSLNLKLALNGATYLWGLRENNPNLGILIEKFGMNENDWVDGEFQIFTSMDEFTGVYWPKVSFDNGAKTTKRR